MKKYIVGTYYKCLGNALLMSSHIFVEKKKIYINTFWLIRETYLYNFDPLKPHFYVIKLEFTGVYIIFFISAQNIDCGYSLELPQQGSSNKYPQSMFLKRNMKNIRIFVWKLSVFGGEISIYLNRCVSVMCKNVLSGVFVRMYWKEMLQRDNCNRYHNMYFCGEMNIIFHSSR